MVTDQTVTVVEKTDERWRLTPEVQQQEQDIRTLMQSGNNEKADQALATLRRAIGLTILDADHQKMGIGSSRGGTLLVDWLQSMGSHEIVATMDRLQSLATENRQCWKQARINTGSWDPEAIAKEARLQSNALLGTFSDTCKETWSEDKTVLALSDMDPFWDGPDCPGYESYEIWDLITLRRIEYGGRSQGEGPSISAMVQEAAKSGQIVDGFIW